MQRVAQAQKGSRRQDIELLRIASAFGIVWFHTALPGIAIAYSGLAAFLVLSVYLAGQPAGSLLSTARTRAIRLLTPWLIWLGTYGVVNIERGEAFLPHGTGALTAILAGSSIHLWYLPFIFLVLCGCDALARLKVPRVIGLGAGLAALLLVASSPAWRPLTLALPYPKLQWADAAAPVLFGLFLRNAKILPYAARWAILTAIIFASAIAGFFNSIGISYAIGFSTCILVAYADLSKFIPVSLEPISSLTFGIYLAHPLVFLGLLLYTTTPEYIMPFAIFTTAAIGTAVVQLVRRQVKTYFAT